MRSHTQATTEMYHAYTVLRVMRDRCVVFDNSRQQVTSGENADGKLFARQHSHRSRSRNTSRETFLAIPTTFRCVEKRDTHTSSQDIFSDSERRSKNKHWRHRLCKRGQRRSTPNLPEQRGIRPSAAPTDSAVNRRDPCSQRHRTGNTPGSWHVFDIGSLTRAHALARREHFLRQRPDEVSIGKSRHCRRAGLARPASSTKSWHQI